VESQAILRFKKLLEFFTNFEWIFIVSIVNIWNGDNTKIWMKTK
jgi:hypothetical protein